MIIYQSVGLDRALVHKFDKLIMPSIRTYSRDKNLVNLRREQIARSAALLFVKKGYHTAGIREIAKVCRMSIGTLYHYVGSKEDILSLVFDYVMSRETRFSEDASSYKTLLPTEAIQKAIEAYYQGIDDIQDMVLLAYQESKSLPREIRERTFEQERSIISVFEGILARGCKTGEFKVNDITLVANNIVVIGDTWAFRRWLLANHYTLQEYIKEQTNLILDQIRSHNR
jgi:AcrR family transcriptional regulator